jgi:cytosine/uracil/thiamine/allantoin permease
MAIVWSIASALIGTVAFRLVAAIMAGYQAFPALVLAGAVAWALPTARDFVPEGGQVAATGIGRPTIDAIILMIQLICGFFATHAVLGADWGNASRSEGDVRKGGWVGVALASAAVATLGLLVVAGARGRELVGGMQPVRSSAAWETYTVTHALMKGVGGPTATLALFILGLAMLGPACFTPYLFSRLARPIIPRLPRWSLSLLAAILTWPLLFLRLPVRLDVVFGLLGAVATPLVAVIASHAWLRRAGSPSAQNWNAGALFAWGLGALVGLILVFFPLVSEANGWRIQPAVLWAYGTAFLADQACMRFLKAAKPAKA